MSAHNICFCGEKYLLDLLPGATCTLPLNWIMLQVWSVSYCHQDAAADSPGTLLLSPDREC